MDTVSFTEMKDGTKEDYALLDRIACEHRDKHLVDDILGMLERLATPGSGYKIDRLQHSLQSATRAERAGEDEEMIVAALLHDIGDVLAPDNHSDLAAAILQPYVSEKTHWIVQHHGIFQGYYFWHHMGGDKNARDKYRGHPWFDDCAKFCANYDQNCFDPAYDTLPLSHFEPMVRRLFSRKPFSEITKG